MSVPMPCALGTDNSDQEAARAGAEIRNAQRPCARSARVDRRQGRLDHGFGLRPRHERGWADAHRQTPEFLAADDRSHAFTREPPRAQGRDPAHLDGAKVTFRRGHEAGMIETEHKLTSTRASSLGRLYSGVETRPRAHVGRPIDEA